MVTSWKHTVQAVPSKKKTSGRKEERKTRWKRGEEEEKKRMEGVCAEEGETDVEEKKKQKRGE